MWLVYMFQCGTAHPVYDRGIGGVSSHKVDARAIIALFKTCIAKFSTDTSNYAHVLDAANGITSGTLVTVASIDAAMANGRILGPYYEAALAVAANSTWSVLFVCPKPNQRRSRNRNQR